MDDIRDKFPMPPCYMCGRGMCVKYGPGEGYRCTTCGQKYILGETDRPMNGLHTASVRPLVMNLRLVATHYVMAMEEAMEVLQYEKMVEVTETYRKWLDEVGLAMANHVGEVRRGEEPELLAEADDSDWLSDAQLRKIR